MDLRIHQMKRREREKRAHSHMKIKKHFFSYYYVLLQKHFCMLASTIRFFLPVLLMKIDPVFTMQLVRIGDLRNLRKPAVLFLYCAGRTHEVSFVTLW